MRITDYLTRTSTKVYLSATDKETAIHELVELALDEKLAAHKREIVAAVFQREKISSTGIGHGIGIPHARIDQTERLIVACGLCRSPIDFDSLDQKPVKLVFLLLGPKEPPDLQIRFLARVSRLLNNRRLRGQLLKCTTADEFYDTLVQYEDEHFC